MAGSRVGQCMSTAYREAARGVCVIFSYARTEIARSSFSERVAGDGDGDGDGNGAGIGIGIGVSWQGGPIWKWGWDGCCHYSHGVVVVSCHAINISPSYRGLGEQAWSVVRIVAMA